MRTPWRFVSDLVSRKPADKPQDAPPPAVVDAKPLDLVAVHEGKPEQTTDVEPSPADLSADPNTRDEVETAPPIPAEPPSETPEPESAVVDAAPPAIEVSVTDGDQDPVVAPHTGERNGVAAATEIATVTRTETAPEPKARSTSKRAKVLTAAAPQTPDEAAVATAKTFLEEMADLDHEIATLRRQLSAKLAKQNAQMRALLDRYEKR